jgi:phosphoribosylanthranilate isomerase
MSRTRVKICGITNSHDAEIAVDSGADAIGMVFYPDSPRNISLSQAREIVSRVPPFVTTVGLFVNSSAQQINRVINAVSLDLLQFHGDEDEEFCSHFQRPYLKVVRVQANTDLHRLCQQYASARGLLVDSYKPGIPGGTGETFDWSMIPRDLPLPLVLAGGLNAGNVESALARVQPYAVDVSSGVESSPGVKDVEKISGFMRAVANFSARN